jgi:hypothetical protein
MAAVGEVIVMVQGKAATGGDNKASMQQRANQHGLRRTTAQHSTPMHSAAQHSTAQHSKLDAQ